MSLASYKCAYANMSCSSTDRTIHCWLPLVLLLPARLSSRNAQDRRQECSVLTPLSLPVIAHYRLVGNMGVLKKRVLLLVQKRPCRFQKALHLAQTHQQSNVDNDWSLAKGLIGGYMVEGLPAGPAKQPYKTRS